MRAAPIFCGVGTAILLVMAGLHISGIGYMTGEVEASNLSDFIKSIFPVLFAQASIALLVLAVFGAYATLAPQPRRVLSVIIAVAAAVNAVCAIYLGIMEPALILGASALCFAASALLAREPA